MDIFAIEKIRSKLFKNLNFSELENTSNKIFELTNFDTDTFLETRVYKKGNQIFNEMIVRDIDDNKVYKAVNVKRLD